MPSGKTIKLILYEVLQFAALSVPVFVVMERFASLMNDVRGMDLTAYWLVVAASIAYVTSVTLLVWVPLKYAILRKRRFITEITQWRPTALAYLILCTLPCFAILISSSKVMSSRLIVLLDHFTELPVSLVLFSLICVDIIERIRPCRLTGQCKASLTGGTNYFQVYVISISPRTAYLYSSPSRPQFFSGPLRFLWARDGRAEVLVDSFLFWLDTVEIVRVSGEPSVFYSGWVFPIYILAFLSTFRLVIMPQSPLLSFAGFALQDFPFLIIRIALIVVFGYVTPVLYPVKNLLVCLTFVYFTFLAKLRIFRGESMF
uniref:Transmembrane protein 236 n=1 Tax=Myripristis murdjan TaxID=586833 RepID=A0A667XN70_9TELE